MPERHYSGIKCSSISIYPFISQKKDWKIQTVFLLLRFGRFPVLSYEILYCFKMIFRIWNTFCMIWDLIFCVLWGQYWKRFWTVLTMLAEENRERPEEQTVNTDCKYLKYKKIMTPSLCSPLLTLFRLFRISSNIVLLNHKKINPISFSICFIPWGSF